MKILKGLHIIFFLFLSALTLAQDVTITGKVTGESDGLPIPGVNILIQGTTKGTVTNFDGNYSIEDTCKGVPYNRIYWRQAWSAVKVVKNIQRLLKGESK